MASVEKQLADIRGNMANDRAHHDSLERRIERIERRLELND
ncbi:MAG TPA: hypothetical protein VK110_04930 [Salinisphaeraceae bacterium]|nr:hypothetical protein [Salinisphaeraceae bacterium]